MTTPQAKIGHPNGQFPTLPAAQVPEEGPEPAGAPLKRRKGTPASGTSPAKPWCEDLGC